MLFDLFDDVRNNTAMYWWVEEPGSENDIEVAPDPYKVVANIINEYMISQGCVLNEKVWIDVSW